MTDTPTNPPPMPNIYFADGTVRGMKRGWYWREVIGPGHFSTPHGPFNSEGAAVWDAAQVRIAELEAEVARLRGSTPPDALEAARTMLDHTAALIRNPLANERMLYPPGTTFDHDGSKALAIVAAALTEAEERGRRRGLEEAAQIIRKYHDEGGHEDGSCASLIEAERRVRALIGDKP